MSVRYRIIKEFPGYRVGDDGSIWSRVRPRSTKKWPWRRMKPATQYRGHRIVELHRDNYRYVHRLVLEAFVGPAPEGMECRHLDGNPANNRLENLRWGTHKENGEDRVRHGTSRKGEEGSAAKLTEDQVKEIMSLRGKVFQRDIAARFGITVPNVQAIFYGASWNHVTGLPKYKPQSNRAGRRPTSDFVKTLSAA